MGDWVQVRLLEAARYFGM